MIFAVGLFAVLFILSYMLLTSTDEGKLSPAGVTASILKKKALSHLTAGDKRKTYEVLGKTPEEILKVGVLVGCSLGFFTLFIGYKFMGVFALAAATIIFMSGILIADMVFQNDYRQWQTKLFDGVPVLVSFMPSFLEVGGVVTPREAMKLTLPFLTEPLNSEMSAVVNQVSLTAKVKQALDDLARRASNPVVDAICFRLSAAWDTRITPDVFADLNDQINDMAEMAAASTTASKGGLLALVCVIGLLGGALIFGYPGIKYLFSSLGGAMQ